MRWTVNVMLVVLTAGITQIAFGGQCIWTCKNGIEWIKQKNPPVIGDPPTYICWYHPTPIGYLVYNDDSSHNSWRTRSIKSAISMAKINVTRGVTHLHIRSMHEEQ